MPADAPRGAAFTVQHESEDAMKLQSASILVLALTLAAWPAPA
jgi:hypothetical protein